MRNTTALLIFVAIFSACGKKDSPVANTPPVERPKGQPGSAVPAEERKNPLDFLKEAQLQEVYNPSGKHDPFKAFEGGEVVYTSDVARAPLERFELNQLELTGIVWGIARPKILFRAPDGYSYIAQVGTGVGRNRGKVTKITRNRVLINEEYRDPSGEYVARESEFVMNTEEKPGDKLFNETELKYSDE